ncbi:MAG TPA: hypothetical protein VE890_08960 [Thermoguttaceae bacterium]|nr:hypothetical protein [Thermoguttaceae bacterium]
MRSIFWTTLILSAVGLVRPAVGFELGCNHAGTCGVGQWNAYCAPPCAAPAYGAEQGCCEDSPSCCDDAWAGYCQEKARHQAFWDNFFSDKSCGRQCATVVHYGPSRSVSCAPTRAMTMPVEAGQSMLAAPVASPRPAPSAEPNVPADLKPPATVPLTEPVSEPVPEPVLPGTTWRWNSLWQR